MVAPTPLREISYRLRRAEPADATAVAALIDRPEDLRQVSPRETFPLDAASVRHWIRERRAGWVLEQQGAPVAYAELVPDNRRNGVYWIGHMMVAPSRRGLGLGRRMVAALMHTAVESLDAVELAISAFADNPRALACYLGCGFVERGRQRVEGRVLVEMRYLVPGRRRLPARPICVAFGAAAVGVSAALLPWAARFWLLERPAWISLALVLGAAALTAAASALLHPMLPRRRAPLSHRLGRPLLYAVVLGGIAALGSFVGVLLVGADLPPAKGGLAWSMLETGLAHGAAWGILLVLGSQLLPPILERHHRVRPLQPR